MPLPFSSKGSKWVKKQARSYLPKAGDTVVTMKPSWKFQRLFQLPIESAPSIAMARKHSSTAHHPQCGSQPTKVSRTMQGGHISAPQKNRFSTRLAMLVCQARALPLPQLVPRACRKVCMAAFLRAPHSRSLKHTHRPHADVSKPRPTLANVPSHWRSFSLLLMS